MVSASNRIVLVSFVAWTTLVAGVACRTAFASGAEAQISGKLAIWHKVTLTFDGPETSERATPNPFTDYRLDVTFVGPSGRKYVVPGFYAADGNAAITSAESGDSSFTLTTLAAARAPAPRNPRWLACRLFVSGWLGVSR